MRILITGATSGIGRACALELAAHGHVVIATGRNREALAELGEVARSTGQHLWPLRLDVTSAEERAAALREVAVLLETRDPGRGASGAPGLDVLINNAGFAQAGFLADLTVDELEAQFAVGLIGQFAVTKCFLPLLVAGHGRILNIGSIMGRMTAPWMGAYGAVKAALRSLTETMRVELAALGVPVVLVEPGAVESALYARTVSDARRSTRERSYFADTNAWLEANDYRPFYLMPAISAAAFAKVVARIVASAHPRGRYVTPFGARMLLLFMRIVPSRLLDAIKRRIFHVRASLALGKVADPA